MTHFQKAPLTPSEQLDLLQHRGLVVHDHQKALRLLEVTTLFRLSPYMRPFQEPGDPSHTFKQGTKLSDVVYVYRFDSELRQLMMVAVERFEVAVRAAISNVMAPKYGAHWYLDRGTFKTRYRRDQMISSLEAIQASEADKFARECRHIRNSNVSEAEKARRIEQRKRDNYPRFYGQTYEAPQLPPSWAVVEELSLGAISHLYQGLARDADRKAIARHFGLPQRVLESWLHTVTAVRNICAHHARLWNRELGVPPQWPKHFPKPTTSTGTDIPRRLFTIAMLMTHITTRISPDSHWLKRFRQLLADHPNIPRQPMGLPQDWEERLRALAGLAGMEA